MNPHKCAIPGCRTFVPERDLMCRRHWVQVPYAHRAMVAKARAGYSRGEVSMVERAAVEARAVATVAPPPVPGVPPANTIYAGVRVTYAGRLVSSAVTRDGSEFRADASRCLRDHSEEFEWGYPGSGPSQLALALVLDATADTVLALRCYQWFKWGKVANWEASWSITAGEIRRLVEQCEREQPADDAADVPAIVTEGGVA